MKISLNDALASVNVSKADKSTSFFRMGKPEVSILRSRDGLLSISGTFVDDVTGDKCSFSLALQAVDAAKIKNRI